MPRSAPSAVAKSPGPKPPYHAATTTERVNTRSGATSPRAGSSTNLAVNATAVAAIATKYCDDLEGSADIYFFSSLYPGEIRDKSQLSALSFRQITMAEILSDALKENQCKGLLRLIAGLTDGAGRPKSARILRLTDVEGKLLQSGGAPVRTENSI